MNNILPGGRPLESLPEAGSRSRVKPVCHFGIVTGESCGTVERVNNGWFTMTNGVVSQKGDSGGPVYVLDGGRAVIVGLFNSTWGNFPAAVTWQATGDQVREDLRHRPSRGMAAADSCAPTSARERTPGSTAPRPAVRVAVDCGVRPPTWPLTSQYHRSR